MEAKEYNKRKKQQQSLTNSRIKSLVKYRAKIFSQKKESKKKISFSSASRELQYKVYRILCKELKPPHTICEAQLPGCTNIATQIHHKKGRRGLLLILSKYFSYQCDHCHKICTKDSKMAKELGLSLPINSKTDWDFTPRELELMEKYGIKHPK